MPCKVQILGESKKYKKNLNLIGVLWEPFRRAPTDYFSWNANWFSSSLFRCSIFIIVPTS
ncbi:hypothetical protein DQM68_02535 [Leptospira mayottensis]|uniref:Uncharacterized protein n=2 Tax=Leptospira mayottensis TaxID=1137606 RepID=A0AA87MN71_9LEPT|nr:hypothetical protein DQM68_02535 [Leptospira mayottensis]AZQ00920.1 hypothetical protein LEP1GSC190_01425 [Leptospira mayottensis 200901116]EKS00534.1 hypothetical protein LEP1GSC125_2703 [Leptospira mayottensis 200901122]AXR63995.1 hypothetical protein DQM28_06930 [Leptospira mayottensis]AXR67301.1 hypothetical protein DPV73_04030 [Leptospira mayottensis]